MDIKPYQKLIAKHFPQLAGQPELRIRPIFEGWDSLVLDVEDRYIFRFPRRLETKLQLQKESALLPELARALSLPIPQFKIVQLGESESLETCFVAYLKLQGQPLAAEILLSPTAVHQLARFLSELHKFPTQQAVQLKVPGFTPQQWRQKYLDFYAWIQTQIFPLLAPAEKTRSAALWEEFLNSEANFQFQPVLIHGDLASEHILCDLDSGRITGIIDWGDAAIGDPALDFTGLLLDGSRQFTEQVLALYQLQVDEAFWQRTIFYSRIVPFYEIRYGLQVKDQFHVQRGLQRLKDCL